MELPQMLQPEARTRLVQGAVAGAIVTMALGFGFGGWMLGSSAHKMSARDSTAAVVAALAPICVDKFQHSAELKTTMVAFNATETWQRDGFVAKGGWATFPGSAEPNRDVAEACAKALSEKAAAEKAAGDKAEK